MEKLVDLLGTKYLTSDLVLELDSVLSAHKELDIADARIGESCMSVVGRKLDNKEVELIDTLNPHRNSMLVENRRRQSLMTQTIPLPPIGELSEMMDYIAKLSMGYIYTLSGEPHGIPLGILISMTRPEVLFDPGMYTPQFFDYIYRNMPSMGIGRWKDFYELIGGTFYLISAENGMLHEPFKGMVPMSEYLSTHICIPGEFGTKDLRNDPDYQLLLERACTDLEQGVWKERPKLITFLGG